VNTFPRRGIARLNGDVRILGVPEFRAGHGELKFIGVAGRKYALEATENYVTWQTVETATAVSGVTVIRDPDMGSSPVRVYRIRQIAR
jgi:hypothetical protein